MASREEMMRRFKESKSTSETKNSEPYNMVGADTKSCPYCGETIMAVAKKCRYCGEWLDGSHQNNSKNVVEEKAVDVVEEDSRLGVMRNGVASEVELSNPSFDYDGGNSVVFKFDRLDNLSKWSTGDLEVICWASLYRYDFENSFGGDSYAILDECFLGNLQQGYGFPNGNCTFNFDREKLGDVRWRFVFTVNELSSDGNWHIVDYANSNLMNLQDSDYGLILDIIEEKLQCDRDEIEIDSHFVNDLGADSLDVVELTMEFENAFGINVPDDEASKIETVGDLIYYIKSVL